MKCALAALLLAVTAAPVAAGDAPKVSVAILMFDGVQVIDFAAPYEVFGQAGFDVHTVSRDGEPVTTAMGLSVNVDHDFESAPRSDILVIPGGNVHAVEKDADTLAWITERSKSAGHVLSICTGASILASTGLLDGHAATTFHKQFDAMEQAFPKVRVVRDQRWVDSGKLVTAAGLASGMDAALHVVAQVRGLKAARSVAMHLEYAWSPDAGFVRGVMADQFMRMPPQPVPFPEGTEYTQLTSIGDTRYWETEYSVRSPLSPAALLDLIRKTAREDPALEILPLPDPLQLAWQYEAQRGGHWRLSFRAYDETADGRFRVVAKVAKLY